MLLARTHLAQSQREVHRVLLVSPVGPRSFKEGAQASVGWDPCPGSHLHPGVGGREPATVPIPVSLSTGRFRDSVGSVPDRAMRQITL